MLYYRCSDSLVCVALQVIASLMVNRRPLCLPMVCSELTQHVSSTLQVYMCVVEVNVLLLLDSLSILVDIDQELCSPVTVLVPFRLDS